MPRQPVERPKRDPSGTAVHRWKVLRTSEVAITPVFRLTARESAHPERAGSTSEFYVLEVPDWVNVIPLTEDDNVVMIRQYRHGRRETTLEIPGGMVDPDDACPLEAARRELREETGYWAGQVEPIGSIAPNPAIQDNLCHSFVARQLSLRGAPDLDGNEEVSVELVPLERIPRLVRRGDITHALVVVAFCHLLGFQLDRRRLED